MKIKSIRLYTAILGLLVSVESLGTTPTNAQFSSKPVTSEAATDPLVLLAMSVDHELFKKAYDDYSDLDGDGFDMADTSYQDDFDYYGYFDSKTCYTYENSSVGFAPHSAASGTNDHTCNATGIYNTAGAWSGNFLNWATMTRIDVIRRVLFGGRRLVDTNDSTVLERAALPHDIHAFGKVFSGSVSHYTPYVSSSVSLCNVTIDTDYGPTVRVAPVAITEWARQNLNQCQADDIPNSLTNAYQLTVRVQACVDGIDTSDATRCKEYDSGSFKPVGLLQRYGESGNSKFGLISGSYDKNLEGGVLRKNIGKFAGNSNSALDEVNLETGQFNDVEGIISNISNFRIINYDYATNKYTDCDTHSIRVDEIKTSVSTGRQCRNWGNPLSEIYLEALRYLSGEDSPTSEFVPAASQIPSNLSIESNWTDPIPLDHQCTSCSLIVLSTGANSFDWDNLGSITDISGLASEATLDSDYTNKIGDAEFPSDFTGEYFLGGMADMTGTGSRNCTAKTTDDLSNARGICPDVPALEGSYDIAGLAYFAKTNDIRPNIPGSTTVSTFAVDLAESKPTFTIPISEGVVTFMPSCEAKRNHADYSWMTCSLFDVAVEYMHHNGDGDLVAASYRFYWEDSQFGNDYDLDAAQRVRFCVGEACQNLGLDYSCPDVLAPGTTCSDTNVANNQIKIISTVAMASAGNQIRFGYYIGGVSDAGQSAWALRPGGDNFTTMRAIADEDTLDDLFPDIESLGLRHTVSAGSSVKLLNKPLYYAAKYGNFTDLDGDGTPNNTNEWDIKRQDGSFGSDGMPDNYYQVKNPARLEESLAQVFSQIHNTIGSGSSVAAVPNTGQGDYNIIRAIYYPEYNQGSQNITWGGVLHSYFFEEAETSPGSGEYQARYREDNHSAGIRGKLDDCSTDRIVEFFTDETVTPPEPKVRRLDCTMTLIEEVSLNEFDDIWNARNELAKVASPEDQRSFSSVIDHSSPTGGRHIISSSLVAGVETVLDFTTDNFGTDSDHEGYLHLAGIGLDASELVNFVRGKEQQTGYRNRLVEFDDEYSSALFGALGEPWLLGDIVHSSPAVVAKPEQLYDYASGDDTYADFKEQYKNRRQVIYVGANDGMLHAINGGFLDVSNARFLTTMDGKRSHPLGSELWAYVPRNLLPHLQWLADPSYQHVAFMDGEVKVFDVNIFSDDATHPGGWGTILVAGMRLGGGEIEVDTNGDDTLDTHLRSAYVIMDITDPERAPVLLAEVSADNLGFTTSEAELVVRRQKDSDGQWRSDNSNGALNEWSLVWGSGPDFDRLDTVTSTTNAYLFTLDLNQLIDSGVGSALTSRNLGVLGFAGSPAVINKNLRDFQDDAIVVGTVEGDTLSPSGRLLRMELGTNDLSTLLSPNQPIFKQPRAISDGTDSWLFFGTGRLLTDADLSSLSPQSLYGVKDSVSTIDVDDLQNTTAVRVFDDGSIDDGSGGAVSVDGDSYTEFVTFKDAMKSKPGWVRNLGVSAVAGSSRSVTTPIYVAKHVVFDEFKPSETGAASCDLGDTSLHTAYYQTGTAYYNQDLYKDTTPAGDEIQDVEELTEGYISDFSQTDHLLLTINNLGEHESEQKKELGNPSSGRSSWQQIFNW